MYLQHFNPFHGKDGRFTSAGKAFVGGLKIAGDLSVDRPGMFKRGSEGTSATSNILRRSADRDRRKKGKEIDLSKMSDQELREALNRMNMEKQYRQLKTEHIRNGKDYAADILDVIGDLIKVGGSAASIAFMIKQYNDAKRKDVKHSGMEYLEQLGVIE